MSRNEVVFAAVTFLAADLRFKWHTESGADLRAPEIREGLE